MRRTVFLCAVLGVWGPSSLSEAQGDTMIDETVTEDAEQVEAEAVNAEDPDIASEDDEAIAVFHDYPTRFARRPLVLHKGMTRADARLTIGGTFGSGTLSALDLGGAVSPIEGLEVGLSTELTGAVPAPGGIGLISVLFSPDAAYGDIPIYGRYQFYEGDKGFLAGVDLVLVLPSRTDFTLTAGIPMRVIELFGLFTIDMNLNLIYRAGNKFDGPSDNTIDFTFGGASAINITDHGYVEIGGGVGVVNINGGAGFDNVVELPFFLGGGYTIQRKVLVDVFTQFGWMPLMTANAPPGRDTFNIGETWFLTLGATIHTRPLW
ncbi:MAG: hypothetical protein AAF436_01710 [Myxococcota bacterium]